MPTGVAFDNFDRFVETSSGKDTLHDTVGIIYQNDPEEGSYMKQFFNNCCFHLFKIHPI